jgi:hypothetical protein
VTATLAEPGQLLGVQIPRLELIPEGVESTSLGDDMAAIAGDAGLDLDPWQVRVLRYGCAVRVDGLFAADTVVVIVSRQIVHPPHPAAGAHGAPLRHER